MYKNIEKEHKLLVSKEDFEALTKFYEPLTFVEQTNVYYDTENNDIETCRGMMRIRTRENRHIFGLKLFDRHNELMEYECYVKENSVLGLNQKDVLDLLRNYGFEAPFHEKARLTTKRAIMVSNDAELCFDINEYNDIVDYEIEYEYKRSHDGFTIFNNILSKVGLHYEKNGPSKIQRVLHVD